MCGLWGAVSAKRSAVSSFLSFHLLKDFARAWALKALTQGAVWIDILAADHAFVRTADGVQPAAGAFDCAAHHDHAKGHAQRDEHQKYKCEEESFHKSSAF